MSGPPGPPRILVVDDDVVVSQVAAAALRSRGFEVVVHDSGFGLAELVREKKPAVIVVDVSMPGLSGDIASESLRALAERWGLRLPPIVLYSGMDREELARRAAAVGADGFVAKTDGPMALAARVEQLLAQSGARGTGEDA